MVLVTPPPLSSPAQSAPISVTQSPNRHSSPRGRRDPPFVMLSSPSRTPQQAQGNGEKTKKTSSTGNKPRTLFSDRSKKSTKKDTNMVLKVLGHLFRTVLLDVPVLLCFTGLCIGAILVRMRDQYWIPQYDAETWSQERWAQENTYYGRHCDPEHQTAFSMDDPELVFQPTDSSLDAKRKMLTHGATLYPNVLSPDTARQVRDFVVKQNRMGKDMIKVIANENRYSFGVQVDQDPSIPKALKEVLGNKRLVAALEEIIGPDPAVIEFTCITSAYGATAQDMHADVIPQGSAQRFARNFVPSYSLFIPIQNTTAEMGATRICPGTHMCATGAFEFCAENGVQASGPQNNWPAGWGALVNQQTLHMGAEHMDPNGPERVLFILTFAPRPRWNRHAVETRILGSGGSYSLHWSQWGHTLSDFADPERRMKAPFRQLRSMGLFKPPNRNWGWDFWTVTHQRVAQEELGYSSDDFFDGLFNGDFDWIPQVIRGTKSTYGSPTKYYEDDTPSPWEVFGTTMIDKTFQLAETSYRVMAAAFAGLLLVANVFYCACGFRTSLYRPIRRMVLGHAVIAFGAWLYLQSMERQTWARNLKQELSFNSERFDYSNRPDLPSTLVNDEDVVDTSEYQSSYLGSYTEVLDYTHGGNSLWRQEVDASYVNYNNMGSSLQNALCSELVSRVEQTGGRFLTKNQENEWGVMTTDMAMNKCDVALRSKVNPVAGHVVKWVDFLFSEVQFGYWRNARGLSSYTMDHLEDMKSKLLKRTSYRKKNDSNDTSKMVGPKILSLVNRIVTLQLERPERNCIPPRVPIEEPFPGAWLQVGDSVEGKYKGQFDEWYKGTIVSISLDMNGWDVVYADDDIDRNLCRECVRRFFPYSVGEKVAAKEMEEAPFVNCQVIEFHEDDMTYDVESLEDGQVFYRMPEEMIRRSSIAPGNGWNEGDRVIAYFPRAMNEGTFPGVISRVLGEGKYQILYDDGDVAVVPANLIVRSLDTN